MIAPLRLRARRLNAPLLAAAAATLLCAASYAAHRLGWISVPALDEAEAALVDARFRVRGARAPEDDAIVIVGLDDETRRRTPEVWQKRAGWARLIAAIGAAEPRAIGIDAFFAAPEIVLPQPVLAEARAAREQLAARPEAERTPAEAAAAAALDRVIEETRGDEKLAAAIAGARVVVLGVLFYLDEPPAQAGVAEPRALALARYGEAFTAAVPRSRRPPSAGAPAAGSLPALAEGAAAAGFVNVVTDDDGGVRRVYGVIERGGRYYAPMGLMMARAASGGADLSYVVGDDRIMFGERGLPVDRRGVAMLDFLGAAGAFPVLSAADVVEGKVPAEALRGKLVFVGRTDAASDRVQTPFDPLLPGVELHATLAHNALHGELRRRAGPMATLAVILALGALLTLLQLRRVRARGAWLVVVAAAAGLSSYVALAFWLFEAERLVMDVAAPAASFVVTALASLSAGLAVEGREKQRIKQAFSQYLDDRAIAQILADPTRLRLGGERRELTVLFSDIRGFSQLAEQLEPERLSAFLNEYLTPMTDLVLESGGLLDKYIGDAIMAVFGAPLSQPDHAARACAVALEMQRRLGELNRGWEARGLPRVAVGIGVSCGPMSVGNMGSERRFDYTVVGDAVNLGARLEALTKEYGASILVSERVAELAGAGFRFRELDTVRVKGRSGIARVFELCGAVGATVAVDVERFARALAAYRARRFDEATSELEAIVAANAGDGPARTLLERARSLREKPPAEGWDGVYEQAGK